MSARYKSLGQAEEGLAIIAKALDVIERTGERIAEAELYRLKGELVLSRGEQGSSLAQDEAEKCLLRAINVAHGQGARSWELSASTSLARLFLKQGRRDKAYAVLAQIYDSFSEGIGTVLLKEAKVVLDELNGD